MACSQFIEPLRVGYLYTYWAPLGFVVAVTMIREAVDDIRRWLRDREVNNALYTKVIRKGQVTLPSAKIQVDSLIHHSLTEQFLQSFTPFHCKHPIITFS